MSDIVEIMARAMRDSEPGMEAKSHLYWTPSARAALTALSEAGYVVVKREPTEAMVVVGTTARWASAMRDPNNVRYIWAAMLSASQPSPIEGEGEEG